MQVDAGAAQVYAGSSSAQQLGLARNHHMNRAAFFLTVLLLVAVPRGYAADPDPTRVLEPVTLNDYFPMTPSPNRASWEARRKELREQVLVATGLWPMPEKTPLQPVVHGKIDRDDYTIEKVFFASYPGHYVSGNLYRPKGNNGQRPGVLCPHGHWANGRFYDAGEKAAQAQIDQGAEKTMEGARYPLQARCAQLARMGCVVFHYDMVGNADSQQIKHREGFTDAPAELRLQSFMGLQTYNSVRSLDFLLSLPDVDPKRIGVTGASGGGTQTFVLCAVDDRPAVAFPAVMVSTAMQGGCVCENCSYLRRGTGNIELAALFAPKPLAMSGADDWTIDIETKGLPELKATYRLYNAEDRVLARCFPQFKHNYNQVSRELMYNWFNRYLKLGQPEPVVERSFVPVPPKELSVFDDKHPRPSDATDVSGLRNYLSEASDRQIATLAPKDETTLNEFRRIVGTALRVMIGDKLPQPDEVQELAVKPAEEQKGVRWRKLLLGRKKEADRIPAVFLSGPNFDGTVVVWIHPAGKSSLVHNGNLVAAAQKVLDMKAAILAVDVSLTGECHGAKLAVDQKYAGFTFGYNRSLLATRVHDILTAVAYAKGQPSTKKVDLIGFEGAGPWVLLARPLCGDSVDRTAADCHQFRFDKITSVNDEMMLPGAMKYSGLPAFAALCAPHPLFVHNFESTGIEQWLRPAYEAAKKDALSGSSEKATAEQVAWWIAR
jgi:dienelactone hydrolase